WLQRAHLMLLTVVLSVLRELLYLKINHCPLLSNEKCLRYKGIKPEIQGNQTRIFKVTYQHPLNPAKLDHSFGLCCLFKNGEMCKYLLTHHPSSYG
uniref:Secreted protein n=1 Tax=Poecilia latipinna TaxID=48699 RepID=A0A3B3URH2_9TELE